MTSHAPAIDLGHNQPPLPNQHFSSWLRSQTALIISQIVAVIDSISLVASTIYYVRHMSGENEKFTLLTIRLIVDSAHLAFIAIFILFLIQVLDDNERGSYRVRLVYARVFREKMDSKEIGEPRESSGTYWLEVRRPTGEDHGRKARRPPGELLCEGIPLRSEEGALDLMDESLSKVPYCKYNRL